MTDENNIVVWEAVYLPFGQAIVNPNSRVENNFRLPGQYYDAETGFHYNWHRYYSPAIGRYLRSDPIGLRGGLNLFLYADGNPVMNVDIRGEAAKACTRPFGGASPLSLKHCYIRFDDGTTLSFDENGVGPDRFPNHLSRDCRPVRAKRVENPECESQDNCQDGCIKREMKKCKGWKLTSNNCCDCVRKALKKCKCNIPYHVKHANWGF